MIILWTFVAVFMYLSLARLLATSCNRTIMLLLLLLLLLPTQKNNNLIIRKDPRRSFIVFSINQIMADRIAAEKKESYPRTTSVVAEQSRARERVVKLSRRSII